MKCSNSFDVLDNCRHFKKLAGSVELGFDVDSLESAITRLYHYVEADGVEKVMCHNDMCDTNLVFSDDEAHVIDWEYAGMADPASDLCSFIVGSAKGEAEVDELLEMYFGRALNAAEARHMYGCIALFAFHWLMWGVYRRSVGHDCGSLMYIWFKYATDYSEKALSMYLPVDQLYIP